MTSRRGFRFASVFGASSVVSGLGIASRLFISVSGQSNSSGSTATPAFSSGTNPFNNRMVANIALHNEITDALDLVQEKPMLGMANWLSFREPNRVVTVDNWGVGGTAYSGLMTGTTPYINGVRGMRTAQTASVGAGSGTIRPVFAWVHGETDEIRFASSSQYVSYLQGIQSDWQRDAQTATTSSVTVPMFYTQIANWSQASPSRLMSEVAMAQFQAHYSSSNLVLVGPTYMLSGAASGVDQHLTNIGARRLGEYFGKAIQRVAISGSTWVPLRPASLTSNADTMVLRLEGGDTTTSISVDTSSVGYRSFNGFSVIDDSDTGPTITYVSQSGARELTIGLSSTAHSNTQLCYGLKSAHGSANGVLGIGYNAGGNIRDNDETPSRQPANDPLRNWLVGFRRRIDNFTAGSEPVRSFVRPAQSFNFSGGGTGPSLHCGRLPATSQSPAVSTFLFSLWFRKTSGSPSSSEVFWSANIANHRWMDFRGDNVGSLRWYIPSSANSTADTAQFIGSPVASGGVWYHVVGFYSGSGASNAERVFGAINGTERVMAETGSIPTSLTRFSSASFEIGSTGGSNQFGAGNISNLALWINPPILSSSFVSLASELYNSGVPSDLNQASIGRPTHWWTLDGTYIDSGSQLPHNHAAPIRSGTFNTTVP